MTHSLLKIHRTHGDQVIKMLQLTFKFVTLKCIKNELLKQNVPVLSLMIFYENRNKFMYKLIGAVIYTIVDEYKFHDYLGLIQDNIKKNFNGDTRKKYIRDPVKKETVHFFMLAI